MKKRTKKKVHNRIINKLISGQPLSDFDRKYHEDMKRKVYIDAVKASSINRVANHMTAATTLPVVKALAIAAKVKSDVEFEKEYSDLREVSDTMRNFGFLVGNDSWPKSAYADLLSLGRRKATPTSARDDAFDSLRYAAEAMHKANVVASTGEPSKWDKVKSKVKGWFGK